MRVTKAQNAEHHRAIIDAASRLFRKRGFDAVTVVDIMQEAGLTHGAFYGHFASKTALAAEAFRLAFERRLAEWTDDMTLTEALDLYFCIGHRDDASSGCPMASLVSKITNLDKVIQKQFSVGVSQYVDRIADRLAARGVRKSQARKQAAAIISTMIGSVALARSVSATDHELSCELLTGARAAIKAQFGV
jgi:TetR/AcrR family transcriptional regulator, transcriptional repressor for nem operon